MVSQQLHGRGAGLQSQWRARGVGFAGLRGQGGQLGQVRRRHAGRPQPALVRPAEHRRGDRWSGAGAFRRRVLSDDGRGCGGAAEIRYELLRVRSRRRPSGLGRALDHGLHLLESDGIGRRHRHLHGESQKAECQGERGPYAGPRRSRRVHHHEPALSVLRNGGLGQGRLDSLRHDAGAVQPRFEPAHSGDQRRFRCELPRDLGQGIESLFCGAIGQGNQPGRRLCGESFFRGVQESG